MAAVQSVFFSNSPRSQIFQDPFYRFQSFAEATQAAQLGIRIDANRATIDDWLRLPGISIHQARLLAALTQSGVQMHDLEDLAAALNTSVERLSPLAPILQFCFYDSNSPDQIQRLNPNRATAQQLVHIPAVDLYLARQIVAERRAGAYRSLVDLQQRLRLSANLVERLLHYLIF
ncbi:MAG: ComEA family DNA-binding protein [Leptolyngbyaceae cyanobacterium SM1_1_3]|nr:ComEA family DNA-binding protein [Leptolyngbyaceae cyanobacterium SM1_1_3]NJM85242.1 ComEA family DNA-binding protein [Leptolyngbyaceae cyanobacterium RM2_2_21]NJN01478.1 ComEA family DNA-binding protein [Leptolyngbyaceae cyanobacterium RM1_1_2]